MEIKPWYPSGIGRYFMSDEAENAAKYQMGENFRKAQAHLAVLEQQFADIGKAWGEAGQIMQSRQRLSVNTSNGGRVIVSDGTTTANILKHHVDWESLTKLVLAYRKTQQEVEDLRSALQRAHLPIPE